MTTLFILNDPPYGTERVYNGLRLAANMQRLDEGHEVVVFLMGDAASAAKSGQTTPNGYYNVNKMLGAVMRRGGRVIVCGTCMDARGLTQDDLLEGAMRSTLDELTQVTLASDKVLVF
ncbi:MAG TPA: DsrE family protein [Motilibacterales bacterium]|nr:DsrE family protein [Motilibacterales bacterium]